MTSTNIQSFYNSPSATDTWYNRPGSAAWKHLHQTQPASLEQHKGKQEVICAVILALCLLFSFVECLAGFAVS